MSRNIIYFLNGSLGDFLMSLVFLKEVAIQEPNLNIYISTPKMLDSFIDLSKKYPNIKVISQKPTTLIRFLFSKNYVILTPTIGKNPWHVKAVSSILSWRGEVLDSSKVFDTKKLYINMLYSYLGDLSLDPKSPDVSLDFEVLETGLSDSYVIFHPFGSNNGRSILREGLRKVFYCIQDSFPNHNVYITGSKEDVKKIPEELRDYSVAGCSILKTANIIRGADLFVGVDTGTTHLASVLGKKSLVIASQGSESYWLPFYNPKAKIIYKIRGVDGVHSSFDFLESQRHGRHRYLENLDIEDICSNINDL